MTFLAGGKYTLKDVRQTYKTEDAWWSVLIADPVASRLIVPVVNHTNITPNQITIVSFIVGMIAAYSFYVGSTVALVTGALLYHVSFILDCMDGKIARLKGTDTVFGFMFDIMLDHIRVTVCALALTVGQFQLTGDMTYLLLTPLLIFAYFFRHYNALMLFKIRHDMQEKRSRVKKERTAEENTEHVNETGQGRATQSHSVLARIKNTLAKYRIRTHLFSGIEFQMFIFIVAPIIGLIPETIIFSTVLLLLFEVVIIYKLWQSTRKFEREVAETDDI